MKLVERMLMGMVWVGLLLCVSGTLYAAWLVNPWSIMPVLTILGVVGYILQ